MTREQAEAQLSSSVDQGWKWAEDHRDLLHDLVIKIQTFPCPPQLKGVQRLALQAMGLVVAEAQIRRLERGEAIFDPNKLEAYHDA